MVFILLTGQRQTEDGHDRVTDELVEHASLLLQALHHQGEVVVQQPHRALGTEGFSEAGETADVAEQHRGPAFHTAEAVGTAA